jgi:1-acyl-sn-glycerol-3-phosphate acyltransferase
VRTPVLDLFRPGVSALCRVYFGLQLRGAEHVPLAGPVIVVPNHQTYADPPLVTIPIRRPVFYMAWDRLFRIPGFGQLIRKLRAFPVDIEARDSAALRQVLRILRSGEAVMIFPEGERTRDGRVAPFKLGAFRLAVSTGAPVVPVTIAGGYECWPPGRWLPRPGRITITYHARLDPDRRLDQRAAARALADATRAAIVSALPAEPDQSSTR